MFYSSEKEAQKLKITQKSGTNPNKNPDFLCPSNWNISRATPEIIPAFLRMCPGLWCQFGTRCCHISMSRTWHGVCEVWVSNITAALTHRAHYVIKRSLLSPNFGATLAPNKKIYGRRDGVWKWGEQKPPKNCCKRLCDNEIKAPSLYLWEKCGIKGQNCPKWMLKESTPCSWGNVE